MQKMRNEESMNDELLFNQSQNSKKFFPSFFALLIMISITFIFAFFAAPYYQYNEISAPVSANEEQTIFRFETDLYHIDNFQHIFSLDAFFIKENNEEKYSKYYANVSLEICFFNDLDKFNVINSFKLLNQSRTFTFSSRVSSSLLPETPLKIYMPHDKFHSSNAANIKIFIQSNDLSKFQKFLLKNIYFSLTKEFFHYMIHFVIIILYMPFIFDIFKESLNSNRNRSTIFLLILVSSAAFSINPFFFIFPTSPSSNIANIVLQSLFISLFRLFMLVQMQLLINKNFQFNSLSFIKQFIICFIYSSIDLHCDYNRILKLRDPFYNNTPMLIDSSIIRIIFDILFSLYVFWLFYGIYKSIDNFSNDIYFLFMIEIASLLITLYSHISSLSSETNQSFMIFHLIHEECLLSIFLFFDVTNSKYQDISQMNEMVDDYQFANSEPSDIQ